MPHAKFGPDPLQTVAVHKQQRNRLTDTRAHSATHIQFYIYM